MNDIPQATRENADEMCPCLVIFNDKTDVDINLTREVYIQRPYDPITERYDCC